MSSGRAREKHFKEKQYERKTTGQRKREKHSGRAHSGSELENDGTRPVVRSEMSDERILYGDFHAVGRAIEAVFRQRAMFSDFGEILRSLSFYISDRAFRTKTNPHARTFQNFRRFYPNPLTFQGVLRIMKTPVNETASVSLRRDCDERTSVRSFFV